MLPGKTTPTSPVLAPRFLRLATEKGSVAKSCIHFCLLSVFRPCCLKYQPASGGGLPQTVPVLAQKFCILGNSSAQGKPGQLVTLQGRNGANVCRSFITAQPVGVYALSELLWASGCGEPTCVCWLRNHPPLHSTHLTSQLTVAESCNIPPTLPPRGNWIFLGGREGGWRE